MAAWAVDFWWLPRRSIDRRNSMGKPSSMINAAVPGRAPEAWPDLWDEFAARHSMGNILQTVRWGQHKATFGWDWDIAAPEATTSPVLSGGALVLYKPLPLHLGTVAYVPRGPLVDWQDQERLSAVWEALRRNARRHRAWALWVEPPLLDTPETQEYLKNLGLRPNSRTIQPARTVLLDIQASEEEVLAQMKSKTRYNIRLAERKGVTVREGTLQDTGVFYALMSETGARDKFGVHSEEYFRRALELFLPTGQVALLLAEIAGEAVAGLMVFALGKTAWYFYGASSDRHRNAMPAYAVQWAAIRWARARGCTIYDLWGIPDADEETLEAHFTERNDGLWGVYRFKRGFGGQIVRYVGLWEQSLHPLYPLAARIWTAL
ncbi:MAG: peptidoglycan bridge formation glycyltransferase FemA/FemB family protein [Anaerolineae bacterium]|nr:peptidoglycan bridge formation glycyltransferase FemA/FemB family protein [Anaerolineae bacterium]